MPMKVIKASAGSGKTYQLTKDYLHCLKNSPGEPNPSFLRSILAITFTNRAVAEMKHRIIRALKEIALKTVNGIALSKETGIEAETAEKWLNTIIRNYDDFRVQTIDSFVFYLLQAMSWEIQSIRPDVVPEFNMEKIISKSFDRLLLRMRYDNRVEDIFKSALKCFLEFERASGFNPERHFKRKTEGILEILRKAEREKLSELYSSFTYDDAKKSWEALVESVVHLIKVCDDEGALINKRARLSLDKIINSNNYRLPDSEYLKKENVQDILYKGRILGNVKRVEDAYSGFRRHLSEYQMVYAISRVKPYIDMFAELLHEVEVVCSSEGIIPAGWWTEMVLKHLEDNIPLVYSVLGGAIEHFLIDEFQDTSREQWNVLFPLIENALASGGTLVCVGDSKQSIYIWRHAEPKLLNEITESFHSVTPEVINLEYNWRSAWNVVDFNNRLFSLQDKEQLRAVVEEYFEKIASDDFIESCVKDIENNFADVIQKLPSSRKHGTGSVKIDIFSEMERDDEPADMVIDRKVIDFIKQFQDEGGNLSDIVILVRTNDQIAELFTLLWREGIPAVTEHSLKIERAPAVGAIINFLRFIYNPKDETSLAGFLLSDVIEGSSNWVHESRKCNLKLHQYIAQFQNDIYNEYFLSFIRGAGRKTVYDIVREIIAKFGVMNKFPEQKSFLLRLMELINNLEGRLGRFVSLSEFVYLWNEEMVEERIGLPEGSGFSSPVSNNSQGTVRIMTIHGAKGLEFPVVIVPLADWRAPFRRILVLDDGRMVGIVKPYHDEIKRTLLKKKKEELLESFNLLYVALTRAKRQLVIIASDSARNPVIRFLISSCLSSNKEVKDKEAKES